MKFADRNKAAKLVTIIDRYDRWMIRTLADLNDAGYYFASVEEARERLSYQIRYPEFDQMQLDSVMYQARKRAERTNERKAS